MIYARSIRIALFLSASLAACASNDHLLFFTNSTIGVEIGSDATAGTPVKFIVGYKRQEGVIDPLIPKYQYVQEKNNNVTEPTNGNTNIILVPNGTAVPDGSLTQPHSVLAKINFGTTAGSETATASQWFATGKAAELVAQSPGVAGALTGDPKNNITQTISIPDSKDNIAVLANLQSVYQLLTNALNSAAPPSGASDIKIAVDKLDDGNFKKSFTAYTWTSGKNAKDVTITKFTPTPDHSFQNIPYYLSNLDSSSDVASTTLSSASITISGAAPTDSQRKAMLEDLQNLKTQSDAGKKAISTNSDVISMINFVYGNILLAKNSSTTGGQ